jgi:hypothetical protein
MSPHVSRESGGDDIKPTVAVKTDQGIPQAQVSHVPHVKLFMGIGLRVLNHGLGSFFRELSGKKASRVNFGNKFFGNKIEVIKKV